MDEKITTLILDCLHQDASRATAAYLSSLRREEWAQLLTLAEQQRVCGLLYHRLRSRALESAIPDAASHALRQRYHATATDNLRLYAELRRIAAALHASDIAVVALKGVHVATVLYQNLGSREMEDIDLMVPVARLGQAAEIIGSLGYEPMLPYRINEAIAGKAHVPRFLKPQVAAVELHWNITDPQRNHSVDPGELWDRVVPASLAGAEVLGLSPEDLLLHLCVHASYRHLFEFGLQPSCDITETVRHFGESLLWHEVRDRARRWHWERGVYLALRLAKDLVGAAVPDEVLEDMRPAGSDDTMIGIARTQILTIRSLGNPVSPVLATLWHTESLTGKLSLFLRRVLVPRAELSQMYGLTPNSPRIYFYYAVRLKDVLSRNSRMGWNLLRGDPMLTSIVERKDALQQWLREG